MTRRISTILLLLIGLLCLFPGKVSAEEQVNLYFFYGNGCPHCAEEEEYLDKFEEKYSNLKIYRYEVWYDQDNSKLLGKVAELMNQDDVGLPFTVVGNNVIVGFSKSMGTQDELEGLIKYYTNNEHRDKVGEMLGIVDQNGDPIDDINVPTSDKIRLPIIGSIDPKSFSLPFITVIMGFLDGFNPCAMWVLLFLISMLINMKDKKRMWILGLTFIVASAVVYYAFMAAWLNVTLFVGSLLWFRILIASVAFIGGIINLRSALNKKDSGCEIVDEKKRKKTFDKIKDFTSSKSFIIAMVGMIGLAVSINIIELFCSAGLPVVYSQILAMNDVSGLGHYGYLLLYVLFFMIDDIIIFVIAMKTFQLKGISTKYGKISHLIGGLIMVIIGVLLLLKPEWLSFWT